jgi:hypothetical protein
VHPRGRARGVGGADREVAAAGQLGGEPPFEISPSMVRELLAERQRERPGESAGESAGGNGHATGSADEGALAIARATIDRSGPMIKRGP